MAHYNELLEYKELLQWYFKFQIVNHYVINMICMGLRFYKTSKTINSPTWS